MAGNPNKMGGPMGKAMGKPPKNKNAGKIFKRLMAYILKSYKIHLFFVAICILISVLASVQGTMFMQTLIDDFIVPLVKAENPDFTDLMQEIIRVASFYHSNQRYPLFLPSLSE